MAKQRSALYGFVMFLLSLVTLVAVIGGWIANVYKLIHMSLDPITGMAVARVIGVFFAPLGVILGYF